MSEPADLVEAQKTGLEIHNTTGGSTTSGGGSYTKIGDGESLAEENKTMEEDLQIDSTNPKEDSNDSDELDDEISKLEQSMVEEDDDTDEDQNQESSGFSSNA